MSSNRFTTWWSPKVSWHSLSIIFVDAGIMPYKWRKAKKDWLLISTYIASQEKRTDPNKEYHKLVEKKYGNITIFWSIDKESPNDVNVLFFWSMIHPFLSWPMRKLFNYFGFFLIIQQARVSNHLVILGKKIMCNDSHYRDQMCIGKSICNNSSFNALKVGRNIEQ